MSASSLLKEAESHGAEFHLDSGEIRIDLSQAKLPETLLAALRLNKNSLRALLEARDLPEHETGVAPAAPMQRAYWIGEQGGLRGSCPAVYAMELLVERLPLQAIQDAAQTVVARHEMLRSGLNDRGELCTQPAASAPNVAFLDLSSTDDPTALETFRQACASQRFTFSGGTSFHLGLAHHPNGGHLFVTLPLWRFDAASTQCLLNEIFHLARGGQVDALPDPAPFSAFATQWAHLKRSTSYKTDENYWAAGLPNLAGPPSLPMARKGMQSAQGDSEYLKHIHAAIDAETWQRLKDRAAARSLTVASAAFAAFGTAISRVSGSQEFTLTCLQSVRDRFAAEAAHCIGNFGETLCVGFDRSGDPAFAELAKSVQSKMWRDRAHILVSGTEVASAWRRKHGYTDGPTFPVTFTMASNIAGQNALISDRSGQLSVPQVFLDHQVFENADGAVLNIDYRSGVYLPGVPEEILETYHAALLALAETDEAWSSPLPGRRGSWPVAPVIGQITEAYERLETGFLQQVAQQPNAIALKAGSRQFSYKEVFSRAAKVANNLVKSGADPGDRIAIHTRKSWQEIVAVLGTLLADMVYVPIHPTVPLDRKRGILSSCQVSVILGVEDAETRELAAECDARAIFIGEEHLGDCTPDAIAPRACPIAYIIHTSGTTGKPKGVTLTHRASLNTIRSLLEAYEIGPNDRCLGLSQLSFDLSVFDIFGTLDAGGQLILPCGDDERSPQRWLELCRAQGVTLWNSVPALLQLSVDMDVAHALRSLRLVFLSGDWVPISLPERIWLQCPTAKVIAMGGATEAAIWSILHDVAEAPAEANSVLYGKAMPEQAIYVLDSNGRICLPYEPGEIYIGGIGLAEGYWGDPEKTQASFAAHPETADRLYKTGDLGRYWPDGVIEFLGRQDTQIKIQGYRIECGDIEAGLIEDDQIREALVLGVDENQGKALHAYVVPNVNGSLDGPDILRQLTQKLPAYMLPTRLFEVDHLPLSPNGKVDAKALSNVKSRDLIAPSSKARVSAQSATERLLSDAWQEALDCAAPSIDDSFFALGGTSFRGMLLMAQLSQRFDGRTLTLADLTAFPTIRSMAKWIDEAPVNESSTCLRRIGGQEGAQPLVFLPPIGGNAACYSNLIEHLSSSFELYAVVARGVDGAAAPLTSIPDMGQLYADEILQVLPSRHPLLVGWSLGGLMGIEVARALKGAVAGLVTIDSRLVDYGGDRAGVDDQSAFLDDIRRSRGNADTMAELLRDPTSAAGETAMAAYAVFSAHRTALQAFHPEPIDVHATLIVSKQNTSQQTGLEPVLPNRQVVTIDADHYSVMQDDYIDTIVAHIKSATETANLEDVYALLVKVRPGFDEPLAPDQKLGTDLGFSSIEQVRIIGLLEDLLDRDIMEDSLDALDIRRLAALLQDTSQ